MGTYRVLQHLLLVLILTFVQVSEEASAAPHDNAPSPATPIPQERQDQGPDLDEENVVLTKPTKPVSKKVQIYYPYQTAISPRIGIVATSERISDGKIDYLVGASYLIPSRKQPQIEVGADVTSETNGYVHVSYRKIFSPNEVFRPYYKFGLAHRVMGDEGLATFTNKDNYMALLALGFEDYLTDPVSARLALQVMAGVEDVVVAITFGYSWGW